MARANRRDVLVDGEIQVVHCLNRCVRRGHAARGQPSIMPHGASHLSLTSFHCFDILGQG